MEALSELIHQWKLATLTVGITLLIVGRFSYQAPDWDVPISLIMALVAYATASWSLHVMLERQWKNLPLMLSVMWFAVDGFYWLYWRWQDPVALETMREAIAPASLSLYWMCGLVWNFRGTANVFLQLVKVHWNRFESTSNSTTP